MYELNYHVVTKTFDGKIQKKPSILDVYGSDYGLLSHNGYYGVTPLALIASFNFEVVDSKHTGLISNQLINALNWIKYKVDVADFNLVVIYDFLFTKSFKNDVETMLKELKSVFKDIVDDNKPLFIFWYTSEEVYKVIKSIDSKYCNCSDENNIIFFS